MYAQICGASWLVNTCSDHMEIFERKLCILGGVNALNTVAHSLVSSTIGVQWGLCVPRAVECMPRYVVLLGL